MIEFVKILTEPLVDAVSTKTNETLEILNHIDDFYNSAWNKLLLFGTVAFAIIGIIVPVFIQWYQKHSLKVNEKELIVKMNFKIDEIKKEIEDEMLKKLNSELQQFKLELLKYKRLSVAQTFHLQSQQNILKGNYYLALIDLTNAAKNYSVCDDDFNLKRVLEVMPSILENLVKEDLKNLKDVDNLDLVEIMTKIKSKPITGALSDYIKEIKKKVHQINSK